MGANFAIGVSNGFDGLRNCLIALGIGYGDEVIFPVHTFAATWLAIVDVGAVPVGCDINMETANIDVEKIEERITNKTKAILVVHMHGNPVEMESVCELANKYNLKLIEDCAQSHGATFKDKKVGTFGDCGVFSFYPTKNLGALGDAGIIVTNSSSCAEDLRMIGNYGRKNENKYDVKVVGRNTRLDPVQAVVLHEFLDSLNLWNSRRKQIARIYQTELSASSNFKLIPSIDNSLNSVWHHFTVLVDKRDEFRKFMMARGIETEIHYPIPSHKQEAFNRYSRLSSYFPAAEFVSERIVSIPCHPWLTDEEIYYVLNEMQNYSL